MSAERAVQSIETSNPPYRRAAMKPRRGDPNDMEIGTRVRTLRLQRGWSQTELGKALNVTFQQIQKYEKGTNRISAGRLQRISEVLNVPVTFFYSGLEGSRDEQRQDDLENAADERHRSSESRPPRSARSRAAWRTEAASG